MPKLKTKNAAKKRFSLTGRNYIYRHQTRHRHKLCKRSHNKKCELKNIIFLTKTNKDQIRKLIPYL